MTVGEIFSLVKTTQIKGLMIHDTLSNYFDFLNLKGFKRLHVCRYFEESVNQRKTSRYYVNHFDKLVPQNETIAGVENEIIPGNWYGATKAQVDANTKRNAVRSGFEYWMNWEKSAKDFYQKMCGELFEVGEIAAYRFLKCCVEDVDKELKCAERMHIDLYSANYDMPFIIQLQDSLHEKYKKELKALRIEL